jgi:hypothetical protein
MLSGFAKNSMNRSPFHSLLSLSLLPLLVATAVGQTTSPAASPAAAPVSYSSLSQLNLLLSQLEQSSQAAQVDLAKLRVERWKTDSANKRQTEGNVESVQRNLQRALPEIIAELRTSPESLTSTFKLYRNLEALYDVFGSVVESAGAFGSKDEFQSLENDLSSLERSRRSFADRMETLASSKEVELTRLRAALQHAQATSEAQLPKKVIVDDNQPPAKPAKKKAAPKATVPKPAITTPPSQPTPQQPKPQ